MRQGHGSPAEAVGANQKSPPVALLASLAALGLFAISLYLPSLPALTTALGTTSGGAQLTMTVYLVGFALGQLVYGPLSDRIGRRPAVISGVAIFIAASVLAALATSIEMLVAARFVQALGACAGPVLGRAIVRDTASGIGVAQILAVISGALALAPTFGLAVGGMSQELLGWRGCFMLLAGLGTAVLLWTIVELPETAGRPSGATPSGRIYRDYWALLQDRGFVSYVLGGSAMASGAYLWHSGSPFLFIGLIGLSPRAFGLLGLVTGAGYFGGTMVARRSAGQIPAARLAQCGAGLALVGALGFVALTAAGVVQTVPILATATIYATGLGVVLPTTAAAALACRSATAGAASAVIGFAQMAVGAVATLLLATFDPRSPLALALLMAACAAISAGGCGLARSRHGVGADQTV